MKTMNKVFLIGNLGADPELRHSGNGVPFTRLNVATHRSVSKGEEGYEDLTQWHSVYVWGAHAESCAKWLAKGALVFIEGEIRQIEIDVEAAEENVENPFRGENQAGRRSRKRQISLVHAHEVKFLNSRARHLDNLPSSRNHHDVAQR